MSRPKVEKATVQFRLGREDKEFLEQYARTKGQTASEIVRGWVSEKITLLEHLTANMKAGKLLDLFMLDIAKRAAPTSGMSQAEVLSILQDPARQDEAVDLVGSAVEEMAGGCAGPDQVTRGQSFKNETRRQRR
jgi:hypothetical protein